MITDKLLHQNMVTNMTENSILQIDPSHKTFSQHTSTQLSGLRTWCSRIIIFLLLIAGAGSEAWATDYVHIMLGAADGSGKRPVTARFVRTNRNDNGRLEASQMSPLVNTHRYYSAATDNGDGTFTVDESSEITSGNHFATDAVVTCYVTYDDYDHSIFSGAYRITLGDGRYPLSNYEKYWNARTSGIFTSGDGTYTNADLWTITGDP